RYYSNLFLSSLGTRHGSLCSFFIVLSPTCECIFKITSKFWKVEGENMNSVIKDYTAYRFRINALPTEITRKGSDIFNQPFYATS
ncbi:MAG: hypothetical protein ACFFC7_35330, partial [Candidatus Hermodarchaeota archaeon]